MATASSAQREPSMEEILASIRRIIEDSDGGRKQPGDTDELRQDLEPAASAVEVADVEAFRADLQAPEIKKPVTLAEVQAQLPAAEPVITRMETPVRPEPVPAKPSMTLAEVSARVAAEPTPPLMADAPEARLIADSLAVAIHNAQLFEEVKHESDVNSAALGLGLRHDHQALPVRRHIVIAGGAGGGEARIGPYPRLAHHQIAAFPVVIHYHDAVVEALVEQFL